MRIAKLIFNDVTNGEGVCVSLWTQGCLFYCPGCHNPETWSFNGGQEVSLQDLTEKIIKSIAANGIVRNFSILGGEPLCPENIDDVYDILWAVKNTYPNIKIFVWTGYEIEELKEKYNNLNIILDNIDVLITGRYIQKERDITLKWRGSRNQKILYKGTDF